MVSIKFKCPKCGNDEIYNSKSVNEVKNPRCRCSNCHNRIYVIYNAVLQTVPPVLQTVPPVLQQSDKMGQQNQKPTEKCKITNYFKDTSVGQTKDSAENSTTNKNETNNKKTGQNKVSHTVPQQSDKMGQQKKSKGIWRNHLFKWKLTLISIKKGFKFDWEQVETGLKFKKLDDCLIEVHENNKLLMLNFDKEVFEKKPDISRSSTLTDAQRILIKLEHMGLKFNKLSICRVQPNHNSATLEHTKFKNAPNQKVTTPRGTMSIDRSDGYPEIEMWDNQQCKDEDDGSGLVEAMVYLPDNFQNLSHDHLLLYETVTKLVKVATQNSACMTAMIKLATDQASKTEVDKNPKTGKKSEATSNGIYS